MKIKFVLMSLFLTVVVLSGCKPVNTTLGTSDSSTNISSVSSESEEESTESTTSSDLSYHQIHPLQEYLDTLEKQKIAIFVEKIESKETFGINEEELFYGASIAKLPIIFYTQEALKSKTFQEESLLTYTDEANHIPGAMIPGGTGIMQNQLEQQDIYSVGQLLEWTIKHSDNLASNTLSYYVAEQNNQEFLNAIEPYYTFEQKKFTKNMNAHTAANLMKAIYQNQIGIPYFLETDWQDDKIGVLDKNVYHKIGTNEGFNHDVAIVDGETPYVLSILSDGFSNNAIELIVKEIDRLMGEEKLSENM